MEKPLLILSLPNSGSDWFADTYVKVYPELRYFREFFNPVNNVKYEDILSIEFGSELYSSYKNIAKFDIDQCEYIYKNTWEKENYNFTKENYSAFKIEFLVKKFNCLVWHRELKNSLPPSRLHVRAWYEAIWYSMIENFDKLDDFLKKIIEFGEKNSSLLNDRIILAYYAYSKKLLFEAKKYNISIINWENINIEDNLLLEKLKFSKLSFFRQNLNCSKKILNLIFNKLN